MDTKSVRDNKHYVQKQVSNMAWWENKCENPEARMNRQRTNQTVQIEKQLDGERKCVAGKGIYMVGKKRRWELSSLLILYFLIRLFFWQDHLVTVELWKSTVPTEVIAAQVKPISSALHRATAARHTRVNGEQYTKVSFSHEVSCV